MNQILDHSEPNYDVIPRQFRPNARSESQPDLRVFDIKFIDPSKLDAQSKLIIMVLLSMRNLEEVFISNKQLSDQTSISVSTLKRRLMDLESLGLLVRSKRSMGRTLETSLDEQAIAKLICESEIAPKSVKQRLYSVAAS